MCTEIGDLERDREKEKADTEIEGRIKRQRGVKETDRSERYSGYRY